ncbi:YybH family protein [Microbacterium terrisoli]|uniref:YybH family protein n=1 Tax=Microbacterium terrisoli TaxID=3242192 RepID=UPI002805A30E|nr:nuclear transport factor 2 family protein [Microbacterium protaetiae]
MTSDDARETAATPADIPRLFVQFVQAGDYEGLASLYEPDAVLALPPGEQTRGNAAIAEVFRQVFTERTPGGEGSALQPVLLADDLAVTSTRMADGRVTAEVARRQPDGSWRWVIDNPSM